MKKLAKKSQKVKYWTPPNGNSVLGVVKGQPQDHDDYLNLLKLRLQELLEREGQNQDQVMWDARQSLESANLPAPSEISKWFEESEFQNLMNWHGLRGPWPKEKQRRLNQVFLKQLYDKTRLLQWIHELTAFLD